MKTLFIIITQPIWVPIRFVYALLKSRHQTLRERWSEEQRNGGHTL